MVKRWHEPISPPKRHCRSRSATEQMPGLARQPATLIARRTAERVHHLGRRSAGAPEGKRLTHVPTPPPCDAPRSPLVRYFLPHSDARRTEKAPPGGGAHSGFAGEAANPSLNSKLSR